MKNAALQILLSLQLLVSGIALSFPQKALAEDSAKLYSLQGTVEVRRSGSNNWLPLHVNEQLKEHDTIRTAADSRAALLMPDGVLVRLNELSVFEFQLKEKTETLNLTQGVAHFFSRKPTQFPTIKTPLVTASIRGTEFTVSSSTKQSQISVLQGAVVAQNTLGEVDLSSGEQASIEPGKAPQKSLLISPLETVQWALYYPAIIDLGSFSDFRAAASSEEMRGMAYLEQWDLDQASNYFKSNTWPSIFGRAVIAYHRDDAIGALRLLESISKPFPASVLLFQAAIHLSSGQVQKLAALHAQYETLSLKLPSDQRVALDQVYYSQQAIVALVQNRRQQAQEIATRWFSRQTPSVAAALTLAAIDQADANLISAQAVIEQALISTPSNPELHARLAELLLSQGMTSRALEESQQALSISANNSHAMSIQGFVQLALLEPARAQESFEKALILSSNSGLSYLGLGLAKVRQGDLAAGRTHIQQAVQLEPTVALYRSYLGKALFEQEEDILAAQEYQQAIQLDPNDPTAYLYRAFQRVSTHQPITALEDIEKSISLNDNRAVYRSRFLLDQDNAVRSSSLAQVYRTLGFSELARSEAIKSIGTDYANYSAHLLLSESYDDSDDLLQAGISEFLIARLLSPVNFNLVRPSDSGSVGLNEYTALFDRDLNRSQVQVNAKSKNHALGSGVSQSGTSGNWGYGLVYNMNYEDGYRENDRLVDHEVYASVQHQLTSNDTLLFDTNMEFQESGDQQIGFSPLENDPDSTQKLKDFIVRTGFNHRFSPGNQVIGQVLYNNSDLSLRDLNFPRPVVANLELDGETSDSFFIFGDATQKTSFRSNGLRFDTQHIYDGSFISNIAGFGLLESSQTLLDQSQISFEELESTAVQTQAENSEGSKRLFNYTTFHLAPWLDLQGGVTFSRLHLSGTPLSVPFSERTRSRQEWSPKVGFIVTPSSSTTLHAAYFETIGTSGIRELEFIEPTVVSGFNQLFFDIFPGTRARNLAVGIDHKLPSKTYVGAELVERHTIRTFKRSFDQFSIDLNDGSILGSSIASDSLDLHSNQDLFKTYLYQVLSPEVSAACEYSLVREDDTSAETLAITQRLKTGVSYFHSSGFLSFLTATWRKQNLDGQEDPLANSVRDFWLLDAGIGYRFAQRHGQVTLGITNILDTKYHYLPTGIDPIFFPGIGAQISAAYNF